MYWPENVDAPIEYGDIIVSLVEVERFGDYIQRTMKIRHAVNNANILIIDCLFLLTVVATQTKSSYFQNKLFLTQRLITLAASITVRSMHRSDVLLTVCLFVPSGIYSL